MTEFASWFLSITNKKPFPYQQSLATSSELPILLDIPTGAGKTAAVVLAWLWRRRFHPDQTIRQKTPRRLIYCLPMRTLVEQTYAAVNNWLFKASLTEEVKLHLLMGGATNNRWDIYPESDCILIGTQDQLLSCALNRGYSISRYRWPVHFALLNNDCLWVMDEVQLMGVGFLTSAQLQAFREEFKTYGTASSLWMSATLDRELLQTVNYQPDHNKIFHLTPEDEAHSVLKQRIRARKRLFKATTVFTGKENDYAKALSTEITKAHIPNTLTLVICNRVSRAQAVYLELKRSVGSQIHKDKPSNCKAAIVQLSLFDINKNFFIEDELLLFHSRFRPHERQVLNQKLSVIKSGILVSTQAVEAGVDISAQTLFTELAPWSSLVQRIGRCNRYGESSDTASVYWVDTDLKNKIAAKPYELEDLEEARTLLSSLTNVGPQSLQQVQAKTRYPEGLIPRRHDLLQLFDTSTDLAGHDVDISLFIRESNETDVAIAWRSWNGDKPSSDKSAPEYVGALQQEELCRVSLFKAKDLLQQLRRRNRHAWVWDSLQGEWLKAKAIYPGLSLLLHVSDGGYSTTLGFTGETKDQPSIVDNQVIELDRDDADVLTHQVGTSVSLTDHCQDVAFEVRQLCSHFGEYGLPLHLLKRAGQWHDLGKAHPVFQEMITRNCPQLLEGGPWAKSEQRTQIQKQRRGFRHELVSALVALQHGEEFLLTYLIAAHHGKVRMTIQPRPIENKPPDSEQKYALGVWQGDEVPAVDLGDGLVIPPQTLSLDCMALGDGEDEESWAAKAVALLKEYGPFKLAFLEAVIRIADWRASASYALDILERTDA